MQKLIAWAFMYSLDGLLADEGTGPVRGVHGPTQTNLR
jgi:hypothetical protein